MALYEQHVDGVKVARAFTVDGSEDDARHAALVTEGGGWRRVDDSTPKPAKSRAKKTEEA